MIEYKTEHTMGEDDLNELIATQVKNKYKPCSITPVIRPTPGKRKPYEIYFIVLFEKGSIE